MLQFAGSHDFKMEQAELWSKIRDAGFLVQCLPGLESVKKQDRDQAACTVRPGFAFVHSSLQVDLEVVDVVEGQSAAIKLRSKGIGATSEIEARFNLAKQESGTRLDWSAEIRSLGGLLKAIPQGLIKASAQKVIEDLLASIETAVQI